MDRYQQKTSGDIKYLFGTEQQTLNYHPDFFIFLPSSEKEIKNN